MLIARCTLLLISTFILSTLATGQEVSLKRQTLSSIGTSSSLIQPSGELLVQQSIGQLSSIGNGKTSFASAHQGFIQPYSILGQMTSTTIEATIFPNPFDHLVYIEFKEHHSSPVDVTILDITGRTVYTQQFSLSKSQLIEINDLELINGSYIICLKTDYKSLSTQLIKS